MKRSAKGEFYGKTNETIRLEGITLTDTDYQRERVDWHFHEQDYFTFLLEGRMLEGNRKEVYECRAGDLLYHNWQDAHYNIGSKVFTRGFHIELCEEWYAGLDLRPELTQGSLRIGDPRVKMLMYAIFKEAKLSGAGGQAGIDALLLQIFGDLGKIRKSADSARPGWVRKLEEMLRDGSTEWTLAALAREVGVHPVHLSRTFRRHFQSTPGDYIRMLRVQRALALLPDPELSLTAIAFECGFADQSHFIRCFKAHQTITPLDYRRLLKKAPAATAPAAAGGAC